jgi:hypothetical protein
MQKALTISDDVIENPCDDSGHGAEEKRLFRAPFDVAGQVLVTFRGLAVDENVVRYTQQRALELGLSRSGTLHAVLTKDCTAEPYLVVVQAGIGARRYEHCARADNAFSALQSALDKLIMA